MAGKGLFKMKRQMTKESEALSSAGSKQSAWSKWGMGLGGLIAMGLTGGAATPLVAALMAGGGTLAGGLLGRKGAKEGWFNTDKAKLKGGRFYRDEAATWKKDIGEKIWTGAATSALTAGMAKLGSGISFGKEGLKATIPGKGLTIGKGGVAVTGEGFKMGDIIKRGAETATYSDSLLGNLGKAIDIKGSVGYNLGGSLKKGLTNLAGDISTGFENKSMDWSTLPEGMSPRDYQALVGERQASYVASEAGPLVDRFSDLDIAPRELIGRPTLDPSSYITPVDAPFTGSKITASQAQESAILQNELKDFQFSDFPQGGSEPWQESLYGGVDPNPMSALPAQKTPIRRSANRLTFGKGYEEDLDPNFRPWHNRLFGD